MVGEDLGVEDRKCAKDLRALGSVRSVFDKSSLKIVCDSDIPFAGACAFKNVNRDHGSKTGELARRWRRGRDSNPRYRL